ncbi:MAG: hypothetical protein R3C09_27345 [Pirellulaceae bacterium]
MIETQTRTTDSKARLILPKSFANSTVIVEHISDTEIRVRKARMVAEDDLRFCKESAAPLSDRDRDRFLKLLAKPAAPTAALEKAVERQTLRKSKPSS